MQALDADRRIYYSRNGNPRQKHYLSEARGAPAQDLWTDIRGLNNQNTERLGYPTQKPVQLVQRILQAHTDTGDTVLDPFCGCGTTIDAAVGLQREWIGIDITYIAVDLIEKRLLHSYGPGIKATYEVLGIPRDLGGAQALFERDPFEFERWAVTRVNAQPNEKQVGDRGIDGVARFPTDAKGGIGRIMVSVKGGKNVGPAFVRDLLGTIQTQRAEMGILITMTPPTRGILDAVNHAGTYTLPVNRQSFPKVQVVTVAQLLQGEKPQMPATHNPYIQATPVKPQAGEQTTLEFQTSN